MARRTRPRSHCAKARRQRLRCAQRGEEQNGSGPGYRSSLRPPDSVASAHALARGLPSRTDQASPQGRGPPDRRCRSRPAYLAPVDAQKQKVRVHAKRNERTRFELVGDRPRHLPDEFRALGTDAVEADGLERPVAAAASNIPAPGPAAPSLVGLCRRRILRVPDPPPPPGGDRIDPAALSLR